MTPYMDGVGNLVGALSERGECAGAIVVPDWCGESLEGAVESLLTAKINPWNQLIEADDFRALEPKLRRCGEPFDV